MIQDAVLICQPEDQTSQQVDEQSPLALMPVGNKPILEHSLDMLAQNGISHVFICCANHVQVLRDRVQTGLWDMHITCLPLGATQGVLAAVSALRSRLSDPFLLLPAPVVSAADVRSLLKGKGPGAVADHMGRTGLITCTRQDLSSDSLKGAATAEEIRACLGTAIHSFELDAPVWSVRSVQEVWDINMHLAQGEEGLHGLIFTDKEVHAGLWQGHGVQVHARATVRPPVRLGDNVRVEAGADVGPSAFVAKDCFVDQRAQMSHSVICDSTYVGRGLEVHQSVVVQNTLIRMPEQQVVHIPDAFLLGSTSTQGPSKVLPVVHRAGALVALLVSTPLLLVMWALRGVEWIDVLGGRLTLELGTGQGAPEVVSIPRFRDSTGWISRLPMLLAVVLGRLALVGIEPLDPQEAEERLTGWEWQRFTAPAGVILPWHALPGQDWDWTEKRVMEIAYAASRSLAQDMILVLQAVKSVFSRK